MENKIVVIAILLIAIFGFLTLVYYLANSSGEKINQEAYTINPNDHVKWSSKRKNILVEYSDFQCPACKAFHNLLKTIEKDNKDVTQNITFVYRNFPLSQHINANPAAYAAEAAAKQNKFYEMSDLLFNTQEQWESQKSPKSFFSDLAKKLNLNLEKFNKDFDSQEVQKKVQDDLSVGETLPIDATPTFFLNGKKVNINSIDEFKNILIDASKNK